MTAVIEDMHIDPEEMRDAAQKLLAARWDRRAAWEGRADPSAALEAEVSEQGWYQLTLPVEQGGLGQGFDALAPIYEEMGKSLAGLCIPGTMAAADALIQSGSDEALAAVAAIVEQGWRIAPVVLPTGQSLASARIPLVIGVPTATHLLVVEEAGKVSLIAADAPGVTVSEVETWDLGRSYGEITLADPGDTVCTLDTAPLLPVLRAHWELAIAWDSIGGALQCLAETVEYMLGRHQFGRPIASFQALKHRAADHKVAIELARSLVSHASNAFSQRAEGWSVLATQARILAGDAYAAMAEDCVQLFGGVGFTWEYSSHLYLKRALANRVVGGDPDVLRDRVSAEVCRKALAARS